MNNPFQQYRNKQISSGSDSETKGPARTSTPKRVHANMPSAVNMTFSLEQMTVTIQAAVAHAVEEATLESQRRENELRQAIQQLTAQVNAVQIAPAYQNRMLRSKQDFSDLLKIKILFCLPA